MKYYIIAGEASGDLHGSNLIKELLHLDTTATIRCWGGDMMQQAGAVIVKHYKDLAFMGFIEVIRNLPVILKNLKFCKQDIQQFAPDVVILIDYPGFNLRIAKWAKEAGFKVIYYISPQVWAWKGSRVKLIKKAVDKMIVILPFEKQYYENKWNYPVIYVGHPLVKVIEDYRKQNKDVVHTRDASINYTSDPSVNNSEKKEIVALLPGSRKQEISVKLPVMLEASKAFTDNRFIIAQAPGLSHLFYKEMMKAYPDVELAGQGETYTLLSNSKAALVTSGTATLETALFEVPQVVCYKGSAISYQIAKRLVDIKYISLVNLIMNKVVVTELIQNNLTSENIIKELNDILYNPERTAQVKADYVTLKKLLQEGGNASEKAAEIIVSFVKKAI